MRLNADIIYQNLLARMPEIEIEGAIDDDMVLIRPEFYQDRNETFLSEHVYVCSADHLPDAPVIEDGVLLICIGRSQALEAFRNKCTIIYIPEGESIFNVFNQVQDAFNRYDSWDGRMNEVLRSTASLQTMLDLCREVFDNPLMLIGSDFRYLAYTDREYLEKTLGISFAGPTFDPELLAQFLTMHEMATDIREPLLLNLLGHSALSVNIFEGNQFLGCITVFGEFRPIWSSDMRLAVHMADIIRQAFGRTQLLAGDRSIIRTALEDMIRGRSVGADERRIISKYNNNRNFLCICLKSGEQPAKMPGGYIASLIEQHFNRAVALEIDDCVVGVIAVPGDPDEIDYRKLGDRYRSFLRRMQLECGMSHLFSDLYEVQYVYGQALAALEMGRKYEGVQGAGTAALASRTGGASGRRLDGAPGGALMYYFEDYIMEMMLDRAAGDMPVRFMYPEGLKRLRKHDMSSPVSYIETLRAYLECNMSVAETARKLQLHRSSLIDRLGRITKILDCDLEDHDTRLLLEMVLRAEMLQK